MRLPLAPIFDSKPKKTPRRNAALNQIKNAKQYSMLLQNHHRLRHHRWQTYPLDIIRIPRISQYSESRKPDFELPTPRPCSTWARKMFFSSWTQKYRAVHQRLRIFKFCKFSFRSSVDRSAVKYLFVICQT